MLTPVPSLKRFEEAVATVSERALRVTSALERHQIPHEVVGGLAVASWVAGVDKMAVRATRDVDIVIRRDDLPRAQAALKEVGFRFRKVLGISMFLDEEEPSVRGGIHLLFENEKVRPEYQHPVPALAAEPPRSAEGYCVAPLESLMRLKLTSFRRKDQVHIDDLMDVGLISPEIEQSLPADLRQRLQQLKDTPQG